MCELLDLNLNRLTIASRLMDVVAVLYIETKLPFIEKVCVSLICYV